MGVCSEFKCVELNFINCRQIWGGGCFWSAVGWGGGEEVEKEREKRERQLNGKQENKVISQRQFLPRQTNSEQVASSLLSSYLT